MEPAQRPKPLGSTGTRPEGCRKQGARATTTARAAWPSSSCSSLQTHTDSRAIFSSSYSEPKENTDTEDSPPPPSPPHTHTMCCLVCAKKPKPRSCTWSSGSHWWGLPLGQEVSQLCLFHRGQFSCKKFMSP